MLMTKIVKIIMIVTALCMSLISTAHDRSSQYHTQSQGGQITYLGNEAIMVEIANQKVLFDPFFHNDFGTYQLVPESIKAKLIGGIAPYDRVKLVLISHAHGDHFDAKQVLRYLKAQTMAKLIAPQQAISKLLALSPDESVVKRLNSVKLSLKQSPQSIAVGNLLVEAVRIPHAGWPARAEIENIVYRLSSRNEGNKESTVIHMGDADPNQQHFDSHTQHWQKRKTDIAFPPYWFYASKQGLHIATEVVNADKTIGLHVPKLVPEALKNSGLDYFSKPGETRLIKGKTINEPID